MSDNVESNEPESVETTMEITPEIQAIIDRSIAAKEDIFKRELAGLNKKNTELATKLSDGDSKSKTVEDRIAAIEKERDLERSRANNVEAFAHAGLSDDWRTAIDNPNPIERAQAIKELIDAETANAASALAAKLGQGDDVPLGSVKRTYKMAELKGKDPATINKLFEDGRIAG